MSECPAARQRVASGRDGTAAGGPGFKWTNHRRREEVRSRFGPLSSNCCRTSEGALRLPARTAEREIRAGTREPGRQWEATRPNNLEAVGALDCQRRSFLFHFSALCPAV